MKSEAFLAYAGLATASFELVKMIASGARTPDETVMEARVIVERHNRILARLAEVEDLRNPAPTGDQP